MHFRTIETTPLPAFNTGRTHTAVLIATLHTAANFEFTKVRSILRKSVDAVIVESQRRDFAVRQ